MKIIYKIVILVRDRPLLFFSISMPLTLLLIFLHTTIYYMSYHMFLNDSAVNDLELVIAVFVIYAPLIPIFIFVVLIFIEYYIHFAFNAMRLSWLLGFEKRRFANALAAWAETKIVADNNTGGEY